MTPARLRLDYNFVKVKNDPVKVTTNRVIYLVALTNADVGDMYYQYRDIDGRILLVPKAVEEDEE